MFSAELKKLRGGKSTLTLVVAHPMGGYDVSVLVCDTSSSLKSERSAADPQIWLMDLEEVYRLSL